MRKIILSASCLAAACVYAALNPGEIPAFAVRSRTIEVNGQPVPTNHHSRFYLNGIKDGVVATGSLWSADLICGEQELAGIIKLYPNLYIKNYPVVLHLITRPVDQNVRIEAQVRWLSGGASEPIRVGQTPDTTFTAQLTGERLGLLLWREEDTAHIEKMATYNRRFWDELSGDALSTNLRPKKFPIVDRFIGGGNDPEEWRDGIENLARAGFSAIMLPAEQEQREMLLAAGLRRTAGAVYSPPGHVFDHKPEITQASLEEWAAKQAAPYFKAGYQGDDIALYAMSDEPGWYFPACFKAVVENPQILKRFHNYLAEQGFAPADFKADDWKDVLPIGRSKARTPQNRKLFYWTTRFYAYDSACYYARATCALEAAFRAPVPMFVNWNFFSGRHWFPGPFGNNPDKTSPDSAMGSHDWFEFARLRGCSMLWTEDWFDDGRAWQWSFYASKLNSAARLGKITFGGYVIPRTAGQRPGGIIQKIMALVGHGAKGLKYFVFGPEYNFPGNCYSSKSKLLPEMARAHAMIAAAEPLLWPGEKQPSPVAILQPRSALVWDPEDPKKQIMDATNNRPESRTVDYMAEIFGLYLALQHANIPVDWIDEDDLTTEGLAQLKVLYITTPAIPSEAINPLLAWIAQGGTLAATSAAITRDRYNDPNPAFWKQAGRVVRPRETLLCPNAATLPVVAETESYNAVGIADDKTAGMQEIKIGKGGVFYFGWLPGCSYWASQGKPVNGLNAGFNEAIRKLIVAPLHFASIQPPVRASAPLVETPVLISKAGAAITLLNWSGQPLEALELEISLPFEPKSAETVAAGALSFESLDKSKIRVKLPLNLADVLMLRP